MKKIIISIIAFVLLYSTAFGASNLWEFYREQGQNLPSISERALTYKDIGNDIYRGTAEQNIKLLDYLKLLENKDMIFGGAQLAVGGETYYLSGAGVSASQTTLNLTKFGYTRPDGNYQTFAMTNFGDLGCGTFQPGTSKKQEFMSFTGITQNSDGTAQLTGLLRGLERFSPYAASTTLQTSHAGGSTFVISNSPPCFYESYANRTASSTITSRWIFDIYPEFKDTTNATTSNQLATKGYVDNIALQGAATSTESVGGIVELATTLETASSTPTTAVKPLVIQAQNASSSPVVGCDGTSTAGSLCIPVAQKDGKLKQTWLNLNEGFVFNSASSTITNISSSLSTTTNATTTTLGISSGNLNLNNISYTFPSSQGASSTALTTNGSGSLTWNTMDWEQIGEIIATSSQSALNVNNFAARKDLKIVFQTTGQSVASNYFLRFNNDGATNYTSFNWANYVVFNSSDGNGYINGSSFSTTSPSYTVFEIGNQTADIKVGTLTGSFGAAGKIPGISTGSFVWNNTSAQITSVSLIAGSGGGFLTNSRITVFGKRN